MKFLIGVLAGDGVGPEVIAEGVKVLVAVARRFGHNFDLRYGRVGGNAIDEFGTPLPEDTLAMCNSVDAVLFGAVGGPKWDDSRARHRPEEGLLDLRKKMGLFANLRPVKVSLELSDSSPLRPELLKGVDMMIVRELTGGLYFGRPKRRWENTRGRRGVDTLLYTEREIERILRVGFELARRRRKRLTSVDKANILESGRLWREIAVELSSSYPDVELEHMLVDSAAMQLVMRPAHFDVIVSGNTFGDILSDEAAVLSGSMGMLPSASLAGLAGTGGRRRRTLSLYEPVHGTAPDIAGKGIANPIATILSVAMLLRLSLGLDAEATAVEEAVEGVLAEGYRTVDISTRGGESLNTVEMGDIIAGRV